MKRERGALFRASRALHLAPFVYLLLIQPGRRPERSGEKKLGLLTEREREKGVLIPSGLEEGRERYDRGKISVN